LVHPGGDVLSQTVHWSSRGVGGGGSLYSPSINPANNDEFYVGCDMSGLYTLRAGNFIQSKKLLLIR
jgi:hypothetical protein